MFDPLNEQDRYANTATLLFFLHTIHKMDLGSGVLDTRMKYMQFATRRLMYQVMKNYEYYSKVKT